MEAYTVVKHLQNTTGHNIYLQVNIFSLYYIKSVQVFSDRIYVKRLYITLLNKIVLNSIDIEK